MFDEPFISSDYMYRISVLRVVQPGWAANPYERCANNIEPCR